MKQRKRLVKQNIKHNVASVISFIPKKEIKIFMELTKVREKRTRDLSDIKCLKSIDNKVFLR